MDNKTEKPARSILFVWGFVIILTTSIVSAVITAFLAYFRSNDIIEATDARLLMAAEMSREIVGLDYHDQIDGPSSVSKEQFDAIVELNDDLCRRLGLQYLWSVLQIHNNKLVFTSATHSDINDSSSPCASFFETHGDPQAFTPALMPEMKPSFSSFHNEWGAGRMILIPRKDSRGRTYIFGASIQLTEYETIIVQSLIVALAIWFAVLCIVFPAVLALSRRLTSPITGLSEAADRMASGDLDTNLPSASVRELQSLSGSFDRMRRKLKHQTETLQKSESRYRSLLSRLPIGVYRNTLGSSGRFLIANEAISKMFGY
jgi:HAMP domain-containing protein